ncbi:GntR family transcriptional repressor for pyruvate dehydrogenase complex [Roseovarius sp. MBR-78]|uniref:FadR/GntR family transcriptional regulator n=1 Tax=Roseovarius sp. MBR-78 TaxID=3156460 RepID=UPI00339B2A90
MTPSRTQTSAPQLGKIRSRSKLSELISGQLRGLILRGELAPGTQLPTESEMIEQFGVSRTVVREAVSALKTDGLVTVHQGRGAFVATDRTLQPFRIVNPGLNERDHIVQILELRLCHEVETAALAAERHTADQMNEIDGALAAMAEAVRHDEPAYEQDFAFHVAIAQATGNLYIANFLSYLGPFIIPRPALRAQMSRDRRDYVETLQMEHAEIRDAIAERNAEAASRAMRTHLTRGLELNRQSG